MVININKFKRTLITSALPYVNNVPHLGNIICTLRADVYSRYIKQKGIDSIFICGSDESGTRTEIEAEKRGLGPEEYCRMMHERLLDNFSWLDIEFDHFGRTSSKSNKKLTQEIFRDLDKKGLIIEKELKMLYCKKDDRYLPDSYVEGKCPHCGSEDAKGDQCDSCSRFLNPSELIEPRCKLCGEKPEIRKEMHLFLDLPRLSDDLERWIRSKEDWKGIIKNMPLQWIKNGLEPRCISRDLKWGTPIPKKGYEDKVFYVWFDAPIGYIGSTYDWAEKNDKDWKVWWQSKDTRLVQFMGKDNVPFHTIIWPSELMSNKRWILPENIVSNEYLNYEGRQFSKSRNIGVFTSDIKDLGISSSVWRFYLASTFPEHKDYDFDWTDMMDKTNNELVANIGNFWFRTLSFTSKHFGEVPAANHGTEDRKTISDAEKLRDEYAKNIEIFEFKEALKKILELSNLANQYFQKNEPWMLIKKDRSRCGTVLNVCLRLTAMIAKMMYPFIPSASKELYGQLGHKPDDAATGGLSVDLDAGDKLGKPKIIFKKIEKDTVVEYKKKFSGEKDKKNNDDMCDNMISYDDFSKMDLRVGTIIEINDHPKADKLYVLKVKLDDEVRQVVAGMKPYYTVDEMKGKQIILIANLEPATIRGVKSEGMVMAAEKGKEVVLAGVDKKIGNGARIC